MKKLSFTFSAAFLVVSMGISVMSCSNEENLDGIDTRAAREITVSGVITGNQTWSGTVNLNGKVFVVNGNLSIAPGTTIIGKAKTSIEESSALIITKTATINAAGTASAPIVFKGEAGKGSWGGVVILGTAAINQPTPQTIEGITSSQAAGNDITYGTPANGKTPAEVDAINNVSSGTLRYVRVEDAGAKLTEGNELNAFTFGGVGSGTTVEYCQAYHGADDAFEFFGGAVNCKYLVSTATDDDAFDFDFGYTGKIQFAVATIDESLSYSSNANGIECDNDGSGSDYTPKTHPVLSNLTIRGASKEFALANLKDGAHFRRNTGFTLVNSIIYGFPYGVELENASSEYTFKNNVVQGWTSCYLGFTPDAAWNNACVVDPNYGLTSPWGGYAGLKPNGSPANTGADFSGLDSWFTTTTYKGAVATGLVANWLTQTWVK